MTVRQSSAKMDLTLLVMRDAGATLLVIAKTLGCGLSTVHKRLEELRHAGIDVANAAQLAAEAQLTGKAKPGDITAAKAEPQKSAIPGPQQPARRKCLGGCGQLFNSLHAGNRICYRCQPKRAGVTSFTPDAS